MIREYQQQLNIAKQVLPTLALQKAADKRTLFEFYFAEESLSLFDDQFSAMRISFEEFKRIVTVELKSLIEQKITEVCR